jgi:hypothetical protein
MAVAGGGIVMGEKRCSEFFVTRMKIEIIFPKKIMKIEIGLWNRLWAT